MNMLVIEHEYAAPADVRPTLEPTLFPCTESVKRSSPTADQDGDPAAERAAPPGREAPGPCIPPAQLKRPMDVATTSEGLEICLEAPGLKEKDIEIEVCGEILTIRGEFRRDTGDAVKVFGLSERHYGPFSRSIDLPGHVPADRIKACLDRGLLTIVVPNPSGPCTTRVQVQSPTYLTETGEALEFAMAAPGLEEDDLKVEVLGRRLTVTGVRATRVVDGKVEQVVPGSSEGALLRIVDLPAEVRAELITAELSRGVLKVTIPNRTEVGPQRVRVQAA